ncbi:MAG TPA: M14 family metallopeptidase [Candidatus Hydrogenedentes bacterium]|nr:M14 family metallopeptidase [Candidatus Hydrogenedentota bacterium]HPG67739.1 M14 family metallopeptidase [Candidatus Hydrogenedentota bacterium]
MARKPLSFLRARVCDGAVVLTAYKSTPTFKNAEAEAQFETLRVYRSDEAAFEFGNDYAEYFDGLSHEDADVVFEGALTATNSRKFTWTDTDASVGRTYAYWMAPAEGVPTGPVAVKVRDPEVWWPYAKIIAAVDALKADYPNLVQVETVGHSAAHRPIKAVRVGTGARAAALIGAVHAGESGPELILPALRDLAANHRPLLDRVAVAAIPCVNVDEREREVLGVPWYLRTNANGVDINRNFPADWETVEYGYGLDSSDPDSSTFRGPQAASELETQAVMAFLWQQGADVVYAYHCLASICGARLLAASCAEGDAAYASRCGDLARAYGLAMKLGVPEGELLSFGTTSGSLAAWCYRKLHTPAFDIEISRHEEDALAACRVDQTDRALLGMYQDRHRKAVIAVLERLAGMA